MQHWLQAILAIPLQHDRNAGVEVDIQVLRLPRGYSERAVRDLPRGNLDARLRLAGELQWIGVRTYHNAIRRCRALVRSRRERCRTVRQDHPDLLVAPGL